MGVFRDFENVLASTKSNRMQYVWYLWGWGPLSLSLSLSLQYVWYLWGWGPLSLSLSLSLQYVWYLWGWGPLTKSEIDETEMELFPPPIPFNPPYFIWEIYIRPHPTISHFTNMAKIRYFLIKCKTWASNALFWTEESALFADNLKYLNGDLLKISQVPTPTSTLLAGNPVYWIE